MQDPEKAAKLNIDEDQLGDVEDIAFKLIRHKNLGPKTNQVMREIPKFLNNPACKKQLMSLLQIVSTRGIQDRSV